MTAVVVGAVIAVVCGGLLIVAVLLVRGSRTATEQDASDAEQARWVARSDTGEAGTWTWTEERRRKAHDLLGRDYEASP